MALAAVLVHGCLLPQDDQVLPDLPPKKNTPPRLLLQTPEQRGTVIRLDNGACVNKERPFSVSVIDPDLGDTIETRWFVDHENFTRIPVNGTELPRATSPERGIVRPIELFYTSGLLYEPTGSGLPHYVTVAVSDRKFKPEGIEVNVDDLDLPDGGTTPDETVVALYTWFEITTERGCP